MDNLYDQVLSVLKQDGRFFSEEGELLRNAVVEASGKMDRALINSLYNNEIIRGKLFVDIDGIAVFDKNAFGYIVNNRDFLPDSYTRYKNKIGLINERGSFISSLRDVELVFPYKDCVLVGGQTKDDQKRKEIFYNELLASDEIDRLLFPKAFTAAKRFTSDGIESVSSLSENENLIIKGNNLITIATLLKRFENQIKCICIDPPYNTSNGGFDYNDSFNHSSWLTFMKNRLEIAFRLLADNGTIFVFCDDVEQAYLKVLMDDIFGRERYIQTVIWRNCDNSNNDAKQFSQDHNYILVYSRNEDWVSNKLDRTEDQASHYSNPDNDPRGPWFDGNPVNSPNPRQNLRYTITAPNGNIINPPANGWRWSRDELARRMSTGEIRFNKSQTGIIRRTYLYEQKGLPPSSLWDICEDPMWVNVEETGHTRQAKYEQKKLFPGVTTSELFKTPKPERVIKKIIDISTVEGDIVLDFFGGSGTTAATAHKMNRQYILCEQMDYIDTFILERMKKVIAGENGGISREVNWQGGGSFVYCELAKLNQLFIEPIQNARSDEEIKELLNRMFKTGFISYKVNPKDINPEAEDYKALTLDEKKSLLVELLDKNQLYINYCDLEDETNNLSEYDRAFTKLFYQED
ncbi:DNA methyltransferase [Butyrivibrio sp. NC2007]|uniref:DNA methyltransferase n=1 Tax=Butyrivibrio sp. NC2007 TaxID=1280683 RepID=UPI0003B3E7D5|nr:site-specific DNA-methyltransferase [Butyrivibrio sp. NC2007]